MCAFKETVLNLVVAIVCFMLGKLSLKIWASSGENYDHRKTKGPQQ